eukprot:1236284-Rhodomonas_salina.1
MSCAPLTPPDAAAPQNTHAMLPSFNTPPGTLLRGNREFRALLHPANPPVFDRRVTHVQERHQRGL